MSSLKTTGAEFTGQPILSSMDITVRQAYSLIPVIAQVQSLPRRGTNHWKHGRRVWRDLPVEELLQPLVGVVDAQLLEGVVCKALEAVDVQDAELVAGGAGLRGQGVVDLPDHCPEEVAVDSLCQCVPRVMCSSDCEGYGYGLLCMLPCACNTFSMLGDASTGPCEAIYCPLLKASPQLEQMEAFGLGSM